MSKEDNQKNKPFQQIIGYLVGGLLVLILIPTAIYFLADFFDAYLGSALFQADQVRITMAIVLLLIGLAFGVWSIITQNIIGKGGPLQIGKIDISPKTQNLVVTGPYKHTRNPMLFGTCLAYFGFALYLNSPTAVLTVIVFMAMMLIFVKKSEEKRLIEDFGESYEEYRNRVSMFIPWFPKVKIIVRNEIPADYKIVEDIIRKAFYNLYVPGCNEHYLAHVMRSHADFLPELDLVLELDDHIIGNIMYTKAKLVDEQGEEKPILTFGPVCISRSHQRKGYGKKLMERSFELAVSLGYDTIVIFGNPGNYVSSGFVSCARRNISIENGIFPSAMLVKELKPNVLDGRKWLYSDSPVMKIDEQAAEQFDAALEPMEKKVQPSQEEFFIHSHSTIHLDESA